MKRNLFRNYRRLRLESLEPRQMLAGDVTVSVSGGNLSILGDSEGNDIQISATGNAGEFVIAAGDVSTTINGGAGPFTVSGVTGDVTIALAEGYDQLEFDSGPAAMHFANNVTIDMGSNIESTQFVHNIIVWGANGVFIGGSLNVAGGYQGGIRIVDTHVTGNVGVTLLGGQGQLSYERGSIGGDLTVGGNNFGGSGNYVSVQASIGGDVNVTLVGQSDRFTLSSSTPSHITVGGSIFAILSTDTLNLQSVSIAGDLVVHGSGNLQLSDFAINGHLIANLEGESGVSTSVGPGYSQVAGNAVFTFASGNGSVGLNFLNVENDLVVRGAGGVEDMRLNNVRAGNSLLIDTGAGNDIVWVHNSSADGEAAILGGAGSDYVRVGNFLGGRSFYVDMSAGFDLVTLSYTSVVQTLSVSLGGDSDQATVYATSARNLSVDAGSGYDHVRIEASAADNLFAGLGDGSDSLAVVSSLARLSALFDGGAGFDVLHSSGNLLNGFVRRNFEVQPA